MSKVYVVSGEAWDSISEHIFGSGVVGVFESKEKALEYVKEKHGTDYCDVWEEGNWIEYEYIDDYRDKIRVTIEEFEVL